MIVCSLLVSEQLGVQTFHYDLVSTSPCFQYIHVAYIHVYAA